MKDVQTALLSASGRAVALTLSLLAAWLFFHLLAQTLITLPGKLHQSEVWQLLGLPGGDE